MSSPTLYSLGLGYYRRGEVRKAISLYKEAIDLGPSSAIMHSDLGVAYKSEGKGSTALRNLKRQSTNF